MTNDAYRFSVRDDTSFRLNEGGGDVTNTWTKYQVTITNDLSEDDVTIETMGTNEYNGIVYPLQTTGTIHHGEQSTVDVFALNGVGMLGVFGEVELNSEVTGGIEPNEGNGLAFKVSGNGTIRVYQNGR